MKGTNFLPQAKKKRNGRKFFYMEKDKEKDKKIRILEVVDNWFPVVDGVVKVVHNYAKRLNKKAECTVLAPKYPNSPEIKEYEQIKCASVSGGKFGVRLPLPREDFVLLKKLREKEYDIIHCHSPATLCGYAMKYAKNHGIPTVFTVHTKYHEEIEANVKVKSLRKLAMKIVLDNIRKADYLWAVSESAKKMLIKDYKIPIECKVVPNGGELEEYISESDVRGTEKEIREKYKDSMILLAVGRLVKVKNFPVIIKAVKILSDKKIDVTLLIAGKGEAEKGLKELAKELGVAEKVIFLGEIKDKTKLASYYLVSDLLLMPSTFDTSSLAVKDAYALSLPVAVVRGAPAAEGVKDGINGFLTDGTPESFAEKIEFAYKNRSLLKETGKKGHEELYLSWDKITDDVLEYYKEIISEYNSGKKK